jgi:hypothetical protein
MKRLALAVAFVAGVALSAGCSAGTATSNVATLDLGATRACAGLRLLVQRRATLSPVDLRSRIAQVYADASASSNPIIRARAVALYADATYLVAGAEPGSFRTDLAAMQSSCAAPPG